MEKARLGPFGFTPVDAPLPNASTGSTTSFHARQWRRSVPRALIKLGQWLCVGSPSDNVAALDAAVARRTPRGPPHRRQRRVWSAGQEAILVSHVGCVSRPAYMATPEGVVSMLPWRRVRY